MPLTERQRAARRELARRAAGNADPRGHAAGAQRQSPACSAHLIPARHHALLARAGERRPDERGHGDRARCAQGSRGIDARVGAQGQRLHARGPLDREPVSEILDLHAGARRIGIGVHDAGEAGAIRTGRGAGDLEGDTLAGRGREAVGVAGQRDHAAAAALLSPGRPPPRARSGPGRPPGARGRSWSSPRARPSGCSAPRCPH